MKKFISTVLAIAFITPMVVLFQAPLQRDVNATATTTAQADGVTDFVTRLYSICLDRQPDTNGLNDWTAKLRSKTITGMEAAYGFIFSPEFQNRSLSNTDYIEKMYLAFLGRPSDTAGKADWLNRMEQGMSRMDLFLGFANSREFTGICESYGIERGDYSASHGFINTAQIKAFVTRLYDVCLGRQPDSAGLADWTNRLASGQITGTEAAAGFFFSNEYKNKNRSDADFVEDLYNCFLGRASDTTGRTSWISQLGNGTSDISIFNGFSQSTEYNNICSSYGITRGGAYSTTESCRANRPAPITGHGRIVSVSTSTHNGVTTTVTTYEDGFTNTQTSGTPESQTATPTPTPIVYEPVARFHELGLQAVELPNGEYIYGKFRDDLAEEFCRVATEYIGAGSWQRMTIENRAQINAMNPEFISLGDPYGQRLDCAWGCHEMRHHGTSDGTNSAGIYACSGLLCYGPTTMDEVLAAFLRSTKGHALTFVGARNEMQIWQNEMGVPASDVRMFWDVEVFTEYQYGYDWKTGNYDWYTVTTTTSASGRLGYIGPDIDYHVVPGSERLANLYNCHETVLHRYDAVTFAFADRLDAEFYPDQLVEGETRIMDIFNIGMGVAVTYAPTEGVAIVRQYSPEQKVQYMNDLFARDGNVDQHLEQGSWTEADLVAYAATLEYPH